MFFSVELLTRDGPLAHVWLAANHGKQQRAVILDADISEDIRLITSQNTDIGDTSLPPLALRLSGQLLYGVVRIYGRKTEYLAMDCQTAVSNLIRINRLVDGGSTTNMPNTIPLPGGRNTTTRIVNGVNARGEVRFMNNPTDNLTLRHTVTEGDIEFQLLPELPPDFGTDFNTGPSGPPNLQLDLAHRLPEMSFDTSIEVGRSAPATQLANDEDEDYDLAINMDETLGGVPDLSMDDDIEIGRGGASVADMSHLSTDLDMDVDLGMLTDLNMSSPSELQPQTPGGDLLGDSVHIGGASDPEHGHSHRTRKTLNKRSLVSAFDDKTEYTREEMSDMQAQYAEALAARDLNIANRTADFTNLTSSIYSMPDASRIFDPDYLRSLKHVKTGEGHVEEEQEHQFEQSSLDMDNMDNLDSEINYEDARDHVNDSQDLAILDNLDDLENLDVNLLDDDIEQHEETAAEASQTTLKYAARLRDFLPNTVAETTLGHVNEGASKTEKVRMFLETLVLATKDVLVLDQQEPFGEVKIRAKDSLYESAWAEA